MNRKGLHRLWRKMPRRLSRMLVRAKHKRFSVAEYLASANLASQAATDMTVVVLGMHRSGTSLVGEILSTAGVSMGSDVLQAEVENPRGYFENRLFVNLNDKLLALAGGTWDAPPPRDRILDLAEDRALRTEIELAVHSQAQLRWGWKDPRTTLTIDLFVPHLRRPHYILCSRDETAVAKSLRQRNGFSLADGLALARAYKSALASFISRCSDPKLCVRYEDLFASPASEVRRILDFLRIDHAIDIGIIDRSLKHF